MLVCGKSKKRKEKDKREKTRDKSSRILWDNHGRFFFMPVIPFVSVHWRITLPLSSIDIQPYRLTMQGVRKREGSIEWLLLSPIQNCGCARKHIVVRHKHSNVLVHSFAIDVHTTSRLEEATTNRTIESVTILSDDRRYPGGQCFLFHL